MSCVSSYLHGSVKFTSYSSPVSFIRRSVHICSIPWITRILDENVGVV